MKLTSDLSIPSYLNQTFTCECGHTHTAPIGQILTGDGIIHMLPQVIREHDFKKSFIVYDSITHALAGAVISSLLKENAISSVSYILEDPEPTPDEQALGDLLIHFDPSCDHIIAVGSGTINDLCRFLSFRLGLTYLIVATAPSMDGFASGVAPLIVKHMKTTYEAQTPSAILGDTALLSKAPLPMICAGIGDILGKYTCLCDWEIARLITGEYHCRTIEGIVRKSIDTVVHQLDGAKQRRPEAIQGIMDALVLSGIAMSFAGNSRPASGSEHHLSHYWEMTFLFQGRKPILHGTKVGIATIAVIRAYELLLSRSIDFEAAKALAKEYSPTLWKESMQRSYGPAAPSVIALEEQIEKNSTENRLARLELLKEHWEELKAIAGQLPAADTVYSYLYGLGAAVTPMEVGIDKTTFMDSFMVAKELRNRFGLLQILYDLGITEEIAGAVWGYFMQAPPRS